jgi:probable HAF family extracellular repeat protein
MAAATPSQPRSKHLIVSAAPAARGPIIRAGCCGAVRMRDRPGAFPHRNALLCSGVTQALTSLPLLVFPHKFGPIFALFAPGAQIAQIEVRRWDSNKEVMKTTKIAGVGLACVALLTPLATTQSFAAGQASIVSVPTLGGSGFQVNAANKHAQLTGFSYLPGDASADAFLYSSGALADLGTLGSGVSMGYGINNLGQVVGQSDLPSGETHAFFHDGTHLIDLGTFGGVYSVAVGVNDAGEVAGTSTTPDWQNLAFLYSDGQMTPIGDLGGGSSQATAINQAGTVIGQSFTPDFTYQGFVYKDGTSVSVGSLGSGYSWVWAINNSDMVTGDSALANWDNHAFLYSNGTMHDLGTLGGNYSSARGINDAGQVIGISLTASNAERHGFIYSNGTMTDLGALDGNESDPAAINNAGQVVGYYLTSSGSTHAFLWKDGTMQDLNELLPADSHWELQDAAFITDSGKIIGYGLHNQAFEWYVLNLETANNDPVAVAGPDQTVECHSAVTLNGSASSDPDGDTLSFEWSVGGRVIGTTATITPVLPFGDNLVTLKVTDTHGAAGQANVTVHVVDTTAPTGGCPADTSAVADGQGVAPVPAFTPLLQASDNCTPAGSLHISQSPAAATPLGVGPHPVSIVVADEAGNRSACEVSFTVLDQMAPVITALPSARTVAAGEHCQGIVPDLCSSVTASDNCTPTGQLVVTQSPAAGTALACGSHPVTLQVTDASGNTSSATVPLTITDLTAPVVSSIFASPNIISPRDHDHDHGMVPVRISVKASDNCDSPVHARIVAVTCNEHLHPGAYQITGDLSLKLEAHHEPHHDRVFTIQVQCADASGNASTRSVEVRVNQHDHPGDKLPPKPGRK